MTHGKPISLTNDMWVITSCPTQCLIKPQKRKIPINNELQPTVSVQWREEFNMVEWKTVKCQILNTNIPSFQVNLNYKNTICLRYILWEIWTEAQEIVSLMMLTQYRERKVIIFILFSRLLYILEFMMYCVVELSGATVTLTIPTPFHLS